MTHIDDIVNQKLGIAPRYQDTKVTLTEYLKYLEKHLQNLAKEKVKTEALIHNIKERLSK